MDLALEKVYLVKFRGGVIARVAAANQEHVRKIIDATALAPDASDIESICLDNTDYFFNFYPEETPDAQ